MTTSPGAAIMDIGLITRVARPRPSIGGLGMGKDSGSTMVDGLVDEYHGILVGPCTEKVIQRETICRLVCGASTSPDGFECTHKEWVATYRAATHAAAARGWPGPEDGSVPPVESFAEQAMGVLRRVKIAVGSNGHHIERREKGWVVSNRIGDVLSRDTELVWDGEDATDFSPRYHDSPEAAIASWLRYDAVDQGAQARYTAALKHLGIEYD